MARRKQKQYNDPISAFFGMLLLIGGGGYYIYYKIKGHMDIVKQVLFYVLIALVLVVIGYVFYVIISNLVFFSYSRCVSYIGNTSAINHKATTAIKNKKGWEVNLPNTNKSNYLKLFNSCSEAYTEAFDSEYTGQVLGDKVYEWALIYYPSYIDKAIRRDRIRAKEECKPLFLFYADFFFIIYPYETFMYVYKDMSIGTRMKFIACYNTEEIFDYSVDRFTERRTVIVNEKSQRNIEYYYKYSPVTDAYVSKSTHWKVTNKDGSRSFKGGLLPENNPLIFYLVYGTINYSIGNMTVVDYTFSNCKKVEEFDTLYHRYHEELVMAESYEGITTDKGMTMDSASDITKSSIVESDNLEEQISFDESEEAAEVSISQLSMDELRTRNRNIFKYACDRLNSSPHCGKYEYKVYQCRKDYGLWKRTDAGVYTYLPGELTIELQIHSKENGVESNALIMIKGNLEKIRTYTELIEKYYLVETDNDRFQNYSTINCQKYTEECLGNEMYYIMEMFTLDVLAVQEGKSLKRFTDTNNEVYPKTNTVQKTTNVNVSANNSQSNSIDISRIVCPKKVVKLKLSDGELYIEPIVILNIVPYDNNMCRIDYQIKGTVDAELPFFYIDCYDSEDYRTCHVEIDVNTQKGKWRHDGYFYCPSDVSKINYSTKTYHF